MTACEFQHELFRQLRERAAQPQSFVGELSKVIYKSRPTIYKKMQGQILLTIDELLSICSHYNIDIDPLIRQEPCYSSVIIDSTGTGKDPVRSLKAHVGRWCELPEASMIADVSGLFAHAFIFPEVAGFIRYSEQLRRGEQRAFNLTDMRYDASLISSSSYIGSAFRGLACAEIWRPSMLDQVLADLRIALRNDRFSYPREALELCDLLDNSIPVLRERYRSRIDRQKGHFICLADNALATNRISIQSETRYCLYQGQWTSAWSVTYSQKMARDSYASLTDTLCRYTEMTRDDPDHATRFFNGLRQKVQETRRNIEDHLRSCNG